jgi:tetratricopeptide (TPR) repeat protein
MGDAATWFRKAAAKNPVLCSPYGPVSYKVLKEAVRSDSLNANAHYLLGNLLCDNDPEGALNEWQKSAVLQNTAMVNRNIAFVLANHFNNPLEALKYQAKAIELEPAHAQFILEYDTYSEYACISPAQRLEFIERNKDAVMSWDKTDLRRAELLTFTGKASEAIQILEKQHFYIAEITSLNPHIVWTDSHLSRAIEYLDQKEYDKAVSDLTVIFNFPRNLEIARDSKINIANYWLGKVYQKKGDLKKANDYFALMTSNSDVSNGWGAGDNPLITFFQARAFHELNNPDKAKEIFNQLLKRGNDGLNQKYHEAAVENSVSIQQSRKNDKAESYLCIALAHIGLGNKALAAENLNKASEWNASLYDIKLAKDLLNR